MVKTYWLEGCDGYNKPLPVGAPDNGKSHGLKLEDYMTENEIEEQNLAVQRCIEEMTKQGEQDLENVNSKENSPSHGSPKSKGKLSNLSSSQQPTSKEPSFVKNLKPDLGSSQMDSNESMRMVSEVRHIKHKAKKKKEGRSNDKTNRKTVRRK